MKLVSFQTPSRKKKKKKKYGKRKAIKETTRQEKRNIYLSYGLPGCISTIQPASPLPLPLSSHSFPASPQSSTPDLHAAPSPSPPSPPKSHLYGDRAAVGTPPHRRTVPSRLMTGTAALYSPHPTPPPNKKAWDGEMGSQLTKPWRNPAGRKKPFVSRKRPARVRTVTYMPARRTTPSSKNHASGGDGGGPGAGGAGGGGGGGALHDADPSWVSCNCLATLDGCRPTAATASAAGTTSTATTGAIAPPPPNAGYCESAAVNPKEVNDYDHDDHDHDDGEEEDKSTGTGRTDCCNTEARPTGAGALSITSTWSRAGYEPTITVSTLPSSTLYGSGRRLNETQLVNGEFIATAPGELHEPLRVRTTTTASNRPTRES